MSDLKEQVVGGIKWSMFAKLSTQIFSWISTFVVIRILTPDDYGIVAISSVFIAFIMLFTTGGLTSALVMRQSKSRRDSDLIFSLSLLLNIFFSVALVGFAENIAQWYDSPEVVKVLWVMAAVNLLTSFEVVPVAQLQIDMRFKEKSIVEAASGLSGAVVSLFSAWMGSEYWALIHASIAMAVVRAVGLNWVARSGYGLTFDWSGGKDMFKFAFNMQASSLVWFSYNKADMLIIGKSLGVDKAGVYNVGSEVASIPMSKINAIMTEVAFSAFAKTKDQLEQAKGYLKKALRLMGVVVFPVFFGISAVSNELVLVLLGEKWAEAAIVIMLLCFILPVRMLVSVMGNFAAGMGEAKFHLRSICITAVLVIGSILIGVDYGIVGAAAGWIVGFLLTYVIFIFRFIRKFDLSLSILMPFIPALLISSLMWAVICALSESGLYADAAMHLSVGNDWALMFTLVAKILTGVVVAGPLLIYVYGKEFKSLLSR